MSANRDLPRVIQSWLREDRHEDAEPVLDTVLALISTTPQRRSRWSARRFSPMNNTIRIALAAAAVVVVAFLAYQMLFGPNVGEPGPTETAQPTSTPASTAVPPMPDGLLDPGTYSLLPQDGSSRVIITMPTGWYGGGFGVSKNNSINPPSGAGVLFWGGERNVYGDPCQWEGSEPSPPTGPTVDDLVTALAEQPTRDATAPTDITVDSFTGTAIELSLPTDLNFEDCDSGEVRSWVSLDGETYREHQGPGQHDQLWVVDVDGTRVIIDVTFYEGTSAADLAEIQAILESIQFE